VNKGIDEQSTPKVFLPYQPAPHAHQPIFAVAVGNLLKSACSALVTLSALGLFFVCMVVPGIWPNAASLFFGITGLLILALGFAWITLMLVVDAVALLRGNEFPAAWWYRPWHRFCARRRPRAARRPERR
jgi:hypothetical protein